MVTCTFEETDRVFLTPKGREWAAQSRGNASKAFELIRKKAGLEKCAGGLSIDIHALRGTACTRLLRLGVPWSTVIEVFGWRDAKMLVKHYTHLRIEDLEAGLADTPDLESGAKTQGLGTNSARHQEKKPEGGSHSGPQLKRS